MKNGVCAVSFDRKDIEMNKFAVGCLEAQFHMFDARTQHQVSAPPWIERERCSGGARRV